MAAIKKKVYTCDIKNIRTVDHPICGPAYKQKCNVENINIIKCNNKVVKFYIYLLSYKETVFFWAKGNNPQQH